MVWDVKISDIEKETPMDEDEGWNDRERLGAVKYVAKTLNDNE